VRATTTGPTRAAMSVPWNTGSDDQMHMTMCSPGTFVQQLNIYATSHLDGNMFAACAGLRP
jgi:hypothetical protein